MTLDIQNIESIDLDRALDQVAAYIDTNFDEDTAALLKARLAENIKTIQKDRWFDGFVTIKGKRHLIFSPETFLLGSIGVLVLLGFFKTFIEHQQTMPIDVARAIATYLGGYFSSRYGAAALKTFNDFVNKHE